MASTRQERAEGELDEGLGGPQGEVADYMQRALASKSEGKHERAVSELTSALKACTSPETEFAVLLMRSEAFSSLSKQLRDIPAAQSEQRAIYAPDPCHLAGLGYKDAVAALSLHADSAEALLRKAQAQLLVEKYEDAQEAAARGLELSPGNQELLSVLQQCAAALEEDEMAGVAAAGAADAAAGGGEGEGEEPPQQQQHLCREASAEQCSRKRQRLLARSDDSDCTLCMKLLYEPVTTSCGHTFCKPCFARAMDHGNRCPMCRTVLHVGRELAVTVTLKALLEKSFPEEYAARREEESGLGGDGQEAPIPLFVMTPMLPGERIALNIFEPRYRLMVRRCMEGSRRFGMGTVDSSHQLHPVACECEITECQPLPDGRFYLEIVGRRRFEPLDTAEQDGYRIARPRFLSDEQVPAGSPEAQELAAMATDVEALADTWVQRLKQLAPARRGVAELLHRAGDKPPSTDLERMSFWVANLACPLLEDSSHKLSFLTMASTLERLKAAREVLVHLRDHSTPGCTIM